MRVWGLICLLLTLMGLSAAQDTTFSVGPQYLAPPGSLELFLHPIATPSMSFDSGLKQTSPSEFPSEPGAETAPKADEATYQEVSTILDEERGTALMSIYYGYPRLSVVPGAVEAGPGFSIPSSLLEAGVAQFTSADALHDRGYGVTLGEVAARRKAQKPSGRRVYTNEDLERLRPRD